MFNLNLSKNSSFTAASQKTQDKSSTNPQNPVANPTLSEQQVPRKTKNIVITSTQPETLSNESKKLEINKPNPVQGLKLQNQQNRVSGGKLYVNRPNHDQIIGNATITGAQNSRKEDPQSQSPLDKIKEELFMYKQIKRNTLENKFLEKLINNFQLLTSDRKRRNKILQDLKILEQRNDLIKMPYLQDLTLNNKIESKFYFSLIITQLMLGCEYLSFQGALFLVNKYLVIHKNIFYPQDKFNMVLIFKECNIKILNQISSGSVKNQSYFQKMVKEISYIKDMIFLQYKEFFKRIEKDYQDQNVIRNKLIFSDVFLIGLGKSLWQNFKNLINSQKKKVFHLFEIRIILSGMQTIFSIKPKLYEQKLVMEQILPTIVENIRLIEGTQQFNSKIKLRLINSIDELVLHLMLVHPFTPKTCVKAIDFLVNNGIERYSYLLYFSQKSVENRLYPNPMTTAQTSLFIEKLIQNDNKFSKYSVAKDDFVFSSIHSIIKDNPQRFWDKPDSYKNIKQYLWYVEDTVQQFTQYGYEIDCYYNHRLDQSYRNVWKFAQILALLLFPSLDSSLILKRFYKMIRNRCIINNFIKIGIQLIIVEDPSKRKTNLNQKIDTEPIYEFLLKLIIHSPTVYQNSIALISQYYEKNAIQLEIFGNYLMRYAQNGTNTHTCILAFNRLIKQYSDNEVTAIMDHLCQINKNIHSKLGNRSQITKLQYVIKSLMQNKTNYIPLAKNILLILKNYPKYNSHPWMQKLLNEFNELPQKMHPQNIDEYATILTLCFKFIQHSPKSIMTLQQFFRFKFANQYINHVLEISYQNGVIFNKHIRGNVYNKVFIAVNLLKAMTSLYLKEKTLNEGEIVPYQIRKAIQSQNKDGDYQITMRNTALSYHAISYHLALITVLVSKEFNFDIEINAFPSFKNDILQTLINLNTICLQTKNQINLKIAVIYNKQLEAEINKKINLKLQILDLIFRNPSYLGFQYLIASGSLQLKQKKIMLQRVKEIKGERSLSSMKNKSHFIVIYWKQIQNSKIKVDYSKGWLYVKREVSQIMQFLDVYHNIQDLNRFERQKVNQTMQNLYILSDLLKNSTKEHYIKFILKFHNIFLDFRYNDVNNISTIHQNTSNYQNSLLIFFTAKSFVTNQEFDLFIKQQQLAINVFGFIRDLLKLTYKKNYNLLNDVTNFEIIQFGLAFLIELNSSQTNKWFKEIKRLLVDRPKKQSPMLTRQIIILILINSILKQKISQQLVEFGNRDWLLILNAVQPNVRHSSILICELFTTYDMHFIYFTSACHYLCETAKTKHLEQIYEVSNYRNIKNTVQILLDFLKKTIQSQRSYYSVWIVEVLIEIFMNKNINKNVRQKFCRDIRVGILSMNGLHERIGQLFTKIGYIYSKNYVNLWKSSLNISTNQSRILFSQKQQLLAYLRILTFIFFMDKQEKQALNLNQTMKKDCNKVEQDILLSFLELMPLIGCLLKDQSERQAIIAQCQWQKKLKSFDLTKLSVDSIKSSGIRQLSSDKLSEIWKNRTGLNILHQVSNVQLASISTMWISTLKSAPQSQLNKIFFKNAEILQSYFHKFLKFLQALKKNLIFLKQGDSQIKFVMQFLSSKIYVGSIQVSKQLIYTNMPSLSSSLTLKHEQIKNRLVQSFQFVYSLVKHIYDISSNQKVKSQQKFSKLFNHFLRSCKQIKHYLQYSGSIIEITDHDSNRSEFTYNTKSYTKSKTVWSRQ